MPKLPDSFLKIPIAHRGLHDIRAGRVENSISAILAAKEKGYAIEIDLQLSKDNRAVVFHDDSLKRLTKYKSLVRDHTLDELSQINLGKTNDVILSFSQLLKIVGGDVPLLVELKNQDGTKSNKIGIFEESIAKDTENYIGDIAFMSFNPLSVSACAKAMPNIPRGLVTCDFSKAEWPALNGFIREILRNMDLFKQSQSSFISHDRKDLKAPQVGKIKSLGYPVLTWTITSERQEVKARKVADNITFEKYEPEFP